MATNTYVALSTTVLQSNTTTVTLNNIPQGYTDLEVVINPASSAGTNGIRMRMNSDSASNYSITYANGNGTSAQSTRESNAVNMSLNGYFGIGTTLGTQVYKLIINGYSSANFNKTVLARISGANGGVEMNCGLWRSTAAITSLSFNINTFGSSTGDFIAGSTFSLYGIKSNDNSYTAKATGGTITADTGYIYHTFTSSGTFTPSVAISNAEILVVAGGGGGGVNGGGGGGAGGFRSATGQTFASGTAHTITCGAGGVYQTKGSNSSITGTGYTTFSATGGGGGRDTTPGYSGGSGGGIRSTGTVGAGNEGGYTPVEGYSGAISNEGTCGGGGGGATAAGNVRAAGYPGSGGEGGSGSNAYSYWATVTGTGASGYYAGGGGGAGDQFGRPGSSGGNGGGGAGGGGSAGVAGTAGTANTGGGGGGGSTGGATNGGTGGSGVVIIRYAK